MITDIYTIVLYVELSVIGLFGVLGFIYLLQHCHAWVTDGTVRCNMLIESTMLEVLSYTKAHSDSSYLYISPDCSSGSNGTVGLMFLMGVAVGLPIAVGFYTFTLIVLFCMGVLRFVRFCYRINKHVSIMRHNID